jgi:hypothetical protein
MSEGSSRSTGTGRPRLPPAALERIREAENRAVETLQKSVHPYTPANQDFIHLPSEINAGCWKVIDHLMAFAEAIFDIQASEYAALYPRLVSAGDLLEKEIGPEVVKRTKWFWTKWETLVDIALRARWTPEYYNAYLEDGNKPGSEDEKLTHHFVRQLDEAVAEKIAYWQKYSMEPGPSQEIPSIVATGRKGNKTGVRHEQAPTAGNKGPRSRTEDDRAIHQASTPEVEAPSSGRAADASSLLTNLPGNPLFENPFPDTADPKHSVLASYFVMMEKFRTLADEYPNVSALWQAEFGHWQVWPLPRHDEKVLSERLGGSEEVPYSPGADLHLEYNAINAVEGLIIDAGIKQDELNRILTRDRWLATPQFKASDLWLHAIREFWLSAREDAEASGVDVDVFEKVAEAHGYVPGISTAIGRLVWSLMVTQLKSLKQIVKERQLSTGDEIDGTEEPAGWIQSGKIAYVFAASVYFCGVLAARRADETRDSQGSNASLPSNPAAVAQPALDLAGDVPHIAFRYGQDFPVEDHDAIETVRFEASRKFAAKSVSTFDEWMSAREDWVSELVDGAARVFGRVAVKLHWSADHRRDVLKRFILQAADAGHLTLPRVQRFFAAPRAKQLDDALFPVGSPDTSKSNPSMTPGLPLEPPRAPRKKRGRPVEISDDLKRRALLAKGGRERAKILYQTPYPTVQQVKNVPTILKHFNRKLQQQS